MHLGKKESIKEEHENPTCQSYHPRINLYCHVGLFLWTLYRVEVCVLLYPVPFCYCHAMSIFHII